MHIEQFEEIHTSSNKMTHTEGYETMQYDKTSSIEPFSLIYEVKKNQVLYNKLLPEYATTPHKEKEKVWEQIHAVIIPNYEELSEEIKDTIKITVRKRWKSLRDAVVKDHRLRTECPEYKCRKMSPMMKEMQFLIPFVKYPRKLTDSSDGKHSPDFCKLMNDTTIDLTFPEEPEYSSQDDEIIVTNEALYPSVHLTTSEEAGCQEVEWRDGFRISDGDTYGYNNNPTMNYTIHEVQEESLVKELESVDEVKNYQKRRRTNSEDDLHSKLTELIDRSNEESHDEDRMFLLSLLSDFKRVPVHKKLKVKSAFVTALYEALD